jgi:hypothetical protein
MGRQRNYYMTPKDTEECYQRIQKCGEVIILKGMTHDPNEQILSSISVLKMGKEWLGAHLIRPQDISKVTYQYIEAQGYYLLDEKQAPVIDFDRCYFKDGILRRGRFYYRPSYYTIDP